MASQVSVIDAATEAVAHTRRHLFPIRPLRWLALGFLAFLDQCGRAVTGGGPGGGGRGHGGHWSDGRGGTERGLEGMAEGLREMLAWVSDHAVLVVFAALAGLLVVGGLVALVLWINARGTFMYLDDVASGRGDVARPWREHASAAWSYFGWRLGLALATLAAVAFAAGLVLLVASSVARGRVEGGQGAILLLALAPVLLMLLLALPLLLLAGVALRDFVAPLQLVSGLPCGAAARLLEGLVTEHPGAFVVYLLLKLLLYAATGVVVVVGGCLTCCIGFLPVVMQTVFQPVFYFERSWSLFLLRRMGHDLPGRFGG
jgi:hypothetical protein